MRLQEEGAPYRVLPARLHELTRLDLLPSVFALNRARRIDGRWPPIPDPLRAWALAKLQELSRHQPNDPSVLLIAYLGTGDSDKALALLQEAFLQHSAILASLKVDPIFDRLRDEPGFQHLLRRVGLQ